MPWCTVFEIEGHRDLVSGETIRPRQHQVGMRLDGVAEELQQDQDVVEALRCVTDVDRNQRPTRAAVAGQF
ncbi:hypothetical protein MXEN_02559 [Mycobacterium xenopi RIVM700367]|uniref:Uncharacterized protein n=1 Tax=Mycobacterium xenopi TaxID=1789 RepID=A0AAD1M2B2_MYCXE|nr:hypothetical protein MXEN_02559 [Mycobacterium xenopi RIVM700367]ORX14116.1 hypothetical protein AWC32_14550 [Mycobacterium xenopi]BBU24038.1 hypothetical protein MYXE_38280 [Mycobacterium xenopi]SPX90858.1 Uncharacterised protein [Mycobacterium xenopi]